MDELRPLPPAIPPAPSISIDEAERMIPLGLRTWTVDSAARMQVPIESVAVCAIGAMSGVLGRKICIFPKRNDDWRVIPVHWTALVARPGQKKSAIMEEALRPLEAIEKAAIAKFKGQRHKIAAALVKYKARLDALKEELKAAAKNGDPGDVFILERKLEELEQEREASQIFEERYRTSDATVEKLGELLQQNPNGLILMRDELSGWLKSFDRPGHDADRAFFLECWNGQGQFSVDRIGRGTLHLEALCLTVMGSIQPGRLQSYVLEATRGGSGDDGLLQRFQLMVYPEQISGDPEYIDRAPDHAARNDAKGIFADLLKLKGSDLGLQPTEANPPGLRFSSEAQGPFEEWFLGLERTLAKGKHSAAFESHLAKYRSLVPGLALKFHLVDFVSGATTDHEIRKDSLLKAIAWADFLEGHARKIYSIAENSAAYGAGALARKIADGAVFDGMHVRDIYRNGWSLLDHRDDVLSALRVLENCNWVIIEQEAGKTTDGGRPSQIVRLHPRLKRDLAEGLLSPMN